MGNTGNQGTKPQSILDMSAQEKIAFLKSFDLILSDCDGVIWMLDDSIPQTGAAIELLKNAGKSVKFISNNSLRSDEEYIKKLKVIGVNDVKEDDIVHPVKSLTNYIIKNYKDKPIFSLCSEKMNETFRKNGVIVKTLEVKDKDLTGENIAENVLPKDKVAAVVLDIKFNMTYSELAMAERYLTNDENCQFLVGASDGVIPIGKDCTILGCAGFVKLLQDASGKEPIVMGKPGTRLNEFLVEKYKIKDPERVLFIGDNLDTDIKFGKQSGFKTMLVLSGATKLEQLQKLPAEEKPNYFANGLSDFIEFFKDTTQSKL